MQSVTEIVVRYAETDRMGIAHHANYLVWFEQARTEYTRKLSCSYSELEKRGLMSPLLSVEVHYLRTCTYEDRLQVICRLVKLSQAQMTFAYTVLREGEEQPICTGVTSGLAGSLVTGFSGGLRSGRSAARLYQRFGISSGSSVMRASLGIVMIPPLVCTYMYIMNIDVLICS